MKQGLKDSQFKSMVPFHKPDTLAKYGKKEINSYMLQCRALNIFFIVHVSDEKAIKSA